MFSRVIHVWNHVRIRIGIGSIHVDQYVFFGYCLYMMPNACVLLITSGDVLKSTRFSLLTMGLVSTGYYFYCRDKLARDRFFFDSVRANLQKYVDQQGLDVDVEPPEEPQKVS